MHVGVCALLELSGEFRQQKLRYQNLKEIMIWYRVENEKV